MAKETFGPFYRHTGTENPATEYSKDAWVLNPFTTCSHGCEYCYCPGLLRKKKNDFFQSPDYKRGIDTLSRAIKIIEKKGLPGKKAFLSFVGDPMCEIPTVCGVSTDFETYLSKAQKEYLKLFRSLLCTNNCSNMFTILTKNPGPTRYLWDIMKYSKSSLWTTLTSLRTYMPIMGGTSFLEPPCEGTKCPLPLERIFHLTEASRQGIDAHISCEPIINSDHILLLIENMKNEKITWHFGYISGNHPKIVAQIPFGFCESLKKILPAERIIFKKSMQKYVTS